MRELTPTNERRVGRRRYAPKTRTGCITCRIRRVKCDEAKPYCKRCTTTGRKCDGYTPALSVSTQDGAADVLSTYLSPEAPYDAIERRTFEFFRFRTAPRVSGYFSDTTWDRFVLQVSHSEPAVRYAVNALGALHEERYLRDTGDNSVQAASHVKANFPVAQYSKALHGLQQVLSAEKVSLDVVLTCVLLMTHFEAMRECFIPALLHIENALRLLSSRTLSQALKVDANLVRALMRVDLQGSIFLSMNIPGLPLYTAVTDMELPTALHDLIQARDLINTWTCRLFRFMRVETDVYKFHEPGNVPLELIARSQEFVQAFTDLDQLLWDFMHKPTVKMSVREHHGLAMLRSRVKIDKILSATCVYCEASMYDAFLEEFQAILTNCLYIIHSDEADHRLFSVAMDEGLVHPLTFVATHCRDSRIRHQALDHLKRLPAQQGTWYVEAMAKIAQMCIDFEENGCEGDAPTCQDIPEWRRIHSAGFSGWTLGARTPGGTINMRLRPNGMDGEWVDYVEQMSWDNNFPEAIDEVYRSAIDKGYKSNLITWP